MAELGRTCRVCRETKDFSNFIISRSKNRPFQRHTCKSCQSLQNINRKFRRRYGLTVEDYKGMVRMQGGLCAICNTTGGSRGLCVDHNHSTGKVRQLLCNSCNLLLGMAKENTSTLTKAIEYLDKHHLT